MATLPSIIINRLDAERLERLIDRVAAADRQVAEQLEDELERGEVVEPHEVPADIVSMNSRVEFTDLTRQQAQPGPSMRTTTGDLNATKPLYEVTPSIQPHARP